MRKKKYLLTVALVSILAFTLLIGACVTPFYNNLYITNADGSDPTKITDQKAHYQYVTWSPDGSRIYCLGITDSDMSRMAIFSINTDGSGMISLSDSDATDYFRVSPDGSRIVYESFNALSGLDICVMDIDGSNKTNLTNSTHTDSAPNWSPDSSKIVFQSRRDGNQEIYVIDTDGTNLTNLTNSITDERDPNWSPDGTKIAFVRWEAEDEAWVMDADGSNQIQCSHNEDVIATAWSPDSSMIAYATAEHIYVVNAVGSYEARLTEGLINPNYADSFPEWSPNDMWSPDNGKLVFMAKDDGDYEIYVVDVNTLNITQITDNKVGDRYLTWSPDSGSIIFQHDKEIHVINADGTNDTMLANITGGVVSFSPDGSMIVTVR